MNSPQDQIQLAVEDLGEGLALFDADDRMIYCNRRYREINSSPVDAIVVGSRFDDQLSAFVREGLIPEAVGHEDQWLDERLEKHRNPGDSFEQQFQDGTWIEVRERRLQDGTTSILNLDITRKKLAEFELQIKTDRLRQGVKISKIGYWVYDELSNRYDYVSPEFAEILGRTMDDVIVNFCFWETDYALMHPEDRDKFMRSEADWDANPEDWDVEYRLILPSGETRYIRETGEVVLDATGKLLRSSGTSQDITHLKRVELALKEVEARLERSVERTAELSKLNLGLAREVDEHKISEQSRRASERRFRDFAESSSDWLWEMDEQLRFTFLSERYFEITGANPQRPVEPLHLPSANPARGVNDARNRSALAGYLEGRVPFKSFEYGFSTPDGTKHYARISGTPIFDEQGGFLGYRGTGTDITRAHKLSLHLAHQASHDPLTDLINRRAFERRLVRLLESAKREDSKHALCYLDLDQFKVINDTCGHVAGDELLQQLSGLLKQRVRQRDSIARLGGDEFGVLMERCSIEQAERVADDLRQSVQAFRFVWSGRTFRIAVSIGLVPLDANCGSAAEMLNIADSACYLAKQHGRNRMHVHREGDIDLARRHGEIQWVTRIEQALEHDRFELYSQPIQRIGPGPDDELRVELLLRLRDEHGGMVLPEVFLPAAQRYNLSVRIDRWVVDRAFGWLANAAGRLDRLQFCAINVSGASVADESFLEFVVQRLKSSGVPAHKICFEIAETDVIANLTRAVRFIERLSGRGCQIALDDFGSGLSSFNYLKNLPVNYLKIDQTFVQGIENDAIDLVMVRSINEIGHIMGMQTIAEGVESEALLERLRQVGVDYAQGYALERPAPIQMVEYREV